MRNGHFFCSLHRVTQNPAYERFGFASSLFFPASVSSVPADDPRRHGLRRDIKSILNVLVLLGSIIVIVSLSLEVFHGAAESYYRLYMRVQFWVCIVFLVDFFYRFFLSRRKWRFFFGNLIFLLVSIPYLNIVDAFHLSLSAEAYYLIRLMPLVRGGYGLAIMVGWIARNRVTSLLISYVLMIFALSYFASLVFYSLEHTINPMVTSYGKALWWAFMNVTTVGSNIVPKTATGEVLCVVLAAAGMMLFPIFTAYITARFQPHRQKKQDGDAPAA